MNNTSAVDVSIRRTRPIDHRLIRHDRSWYKYHRAGQKYRKSRIVSRTLIGLTKISSFVKLPEIECTIHTE